MRILKKRSVISLIYYFYSNRNFLFKKVLLIYKRNLFVEEPNFNVFFWYLQDSNAIAVKKKFYIIIRSTYPIELD